MTAFDQLQERVLELEGQLLQAEDRIEYLESGEDKPFDAMVDKVDRIVGRGAADTGALTARITHEVARLDERINKLKPSKRDDMEGFRNAIDNVRERMVKLERSMPRLAVNEPRMCNVDWLGSLQATPLGLPDTVLYCGLPSGHAGQHCHDAGGLSIYWDQYIGGRD